MHQIHYNQGDGHQTIYQVVLTMHLLNYTQFFLRYRKGALEVATYFFHSPTCFRKYNKVSQIWDQLSNFATSISGSQINLTLHICLIFTEIKGLSIPHMRLVHTICVAIHWLFQYLFFHHIYILYTTVQTFICTKPLIDCINIFFNNYVTE